MATSASGDTTGTRLPGSKVPCLCGERSATASIMSAPHADVVEERVALGGGAVAADPLAGALGGDEELERAELDAERRLGEAAVALERIETRPLLVAEHLGDSRRLGVARAGMGHEHPQRAAVGRHFLDIEDAQTDAPRHLGHHDERQVGEMFVVDLIELQTLDLLEQVRELERRDALRLQQHSEPGHEVEDVGHVRQDVVGRHQIGRVAGIAQPLGGRLSEEGDLGGDAVALRHRRDVGRRFDTEDRHARAHEILQQVAIVARHFDDLAAAVEREAPRHRGDVGFGVAQPARREAREIGVIGEDRLRALELLELDQEAGRADERMQRIELFAFTRSVERHVGVRERRQAEVDETVRERRATNPAALCPLARV